MTSFKMKHSRAKLIRSLPISCKRTALIKKHIEEVNRLKINDGLNADSDIHYILFRHAQKGKIAMYKYL